MGHEIDDRNPIWIKEKADNFFKNKDYRSAINVYNKSIEIDPDFHKCYLNRATCLFYLGEFDLALQDLNKLTYMIENIDAKEKEDMFYTKILIKIKVKSYAIHAIINNYTEALEIISTILTKDNTFILGDKALDKIRKDRQMIEMRLKSEEDKKEADNLIEQKDFEKAEEIYKQILENSYQNEKIISNLSLISVNKKNYIEAINYCTEALKIIKNFNEKIFVRSKKFDNSLELKMLLRRAESYVEIGEMTKAQEDIETAERFEVKNREILDKFNSFKEKLKTIVLENYEKSANDLLKNKQFSEALSLYDRSVALIRKKERTDQIKFYLNRTSCLIALGQYENVVDECNRIHSSLLKQRNIATINSNFAQIKALKELEFNILVKRAYGYTKSNQIALAKKDYNLALEINPADTNIKRNLAALENL
jgi:dyslexia susceptibility 1 candidate gene 1 protein